MHSKLSSMSPLCSYIASPNSSPPSPRLLSSIHISSTMMRLSKLPLRTVPHFYSTFRPSPITLHYNLWGNFNKLPTHSTLPMGISEHFSTSSLSCFTDDPISGKSTRSGPNGPASGPPSIPPSCSSPSDPVGTNVPPSY